MNDNPQESSNPRTVPASVSVSIDMSALDEVTETKMTFKPCLDTQMVVLSTHLTTFTSDIWVRMSRPATTVWSLDRDLRLLRSRLKMEPDEIQRPTISKMTLSTYPKDYPGFWVRIRSFKLSWTALKSTFHFQSSCPSSFYWIMVRVRG